MTHIGLVDQLDSWAKKGRILWNFALKFTPWLWFSFSHFKGNMFLSHSPRSWKRDRETRSMVRERKVNSIQFQSAIQCEMWCNLISAPSSAIELISMVSGSTQRSLHPRELPHQVTSREVHNSHGRRWQNVHWLLMVRFYFLFCFRMRGNFIPRLLLVIQEVLEEENTLNFPQIVEINESTKILSLFLSLLKLIIRVIHIPVNRNTIRKIFIIFFKYFNT